MKKRMLVMLVCVALVIAALAAVKVYQIKSMMAVYANFQPPPEAVTTIVAHQESWPATLGAIGTAVAVHGVNVAADLPGVVQRITFDSGARVRQGDVLVQLDTRQEQAQLAAAEAKRDLTRANLDRLRNLRDERIVSQAEYDQSEAEFKQAEATAGEIRATIGRKTIRAPFTGVLGLRQVNLGQYLAGGDVIVQLQAVNPIYVNFSVPQQQVGRIRTGSEVRVTASGVEAPPATPANRRGDTAGTTGSEEKDRAVGTAGSEEMDRPVGTAGRSAPPVSGKVTAIDSVVDQATRNVQVQATFANPTGALRPGMFVQADVVLGAAQRVMAVPASAINYAPYGDSIFVVGNLKSPKGGTYRGVQQRFVKIGGTRGDQVAIVSGLQPGEEVVTSGVFKLRSGAAVQVNNSVQPSNDPAPRPEEK